MCTGPSLYDVVLKKMGTKLASSGSCEDLEDLESLLCSQLVAWLVSPEGSHLLHKCKCDLLADANATTQCQLPANATMQHQLPTDAVMQCQLPTNATMQCQLPTNAVFCTKKQ
jgi:hypothetical protein